MTSTLQRYQRIAPLYDLLDLPFEYRRYRRIRPLLFEGLSGRVWTRESARDATPLSIRAAQALSGST
jgi:hypothetical protein